VDQDIERNIYFFMAYLVDQAKDLAIEIPQDRAAFEVVPLGYPRSSILRTRVRWADNDFPLSVTFNGPYEADELSELAGEVVERLETFERDADDIGERLSELRDHAELTFARFAKTKVKVKFISLDLQLDDSWSPDSPFAMTYEKLGEDAQPVIRTTFVTDAEDIDAEVFVERKGQKIIAARAREFEKESATAGIDVVLANLLEHHSIDPFSVIKSEKELRGHEVVKLPDGELRLFWKEGVLTADIALDATTQWYGGYIFARNCPAGFEKDVAGRKVRDLIDHESIPEDLAFISGSAQPGTRASFEAPLEYYLYDTNTQTIC
jgi:hypothetical protein